MAPVRIRWNLPAVRECRVVCNQWPADRVYDISAVKLAAADHLTQSLANIYN